MVYVTMEATMLICPAEQFLYVLYWLQKLLFFNFFFSLRLQRSPVESYVVVVRVTLTLSCGTKILSPRRVRKVWMYTELMQLQGKLTISCCSQESQVYISGSCNGKVGGGKKQQCTFKQTVYFKATFKMGLMALSL